MSRKWQRKKLGVIIEQRSGLTWSADQEVNKLASGIVIVLTVSNIQATLIKEPITYLRNVSDEHRKRKIASKGWTIAVGSNGNRKRIGNCVFIEDDTEYLFASFLTAFRPLPESGVLPEYFFRWFSSYEIQARISCSAEGTTGLSNMSDRYLRNLPFDFPSDLREQSGIVQLLALVDSNIAAKQAAITAAARMQQLVMRELLTGRITAEGTIRLQSEFVDDGRGALPRTWSRSRIKDFGGVSTGKTPPTEVAAHFLGDIPFITPGDMGATKWLCITERNVSETGAKMVGKLPAKTVCVVCIGATIGKVGLTNRPSATNQQISSIICSDQHSPEYLYYAIRFFSRHIAAIAGVNATPQLNKSEFSKVRIPMPADLEEEEAIAKRLSELDDLIEAKRAKITALQRLKKSLMQNLLTGRLRLSQEVIAELTAEAGKSGGA